MSDVPRLLHTVLDAVDVRAEAEFWRELLGLTYRPGDEVRDGSDDADWLVLLDAGGGRGLAVQEVEVLTPTHWPEPGHPSVSHLDTTVATRQELDTVHEQVLGLGGELRLDRTDDPDEPLRAYASPAGHVFCVFVAPPPTDTPPRRRTGTCAFRLMPTDDLVTAPSTLAVDAAAGGAQLLTYTWRHPEDGEQAGSLLLGAPAADGAVTAAWTDTWHQRDLTLLVGATCGPVTTVGYDYAPGWRWEVDLVLDARPRTGMVMRNVVPEGQDGPAGPYDVMRARWT